MFVTEDGKYKYLINCAMTLTWILTINILFAGNSTPHSGQVFHALVHILSTLKDPKYEQFQSVIDAYINDHFAAALVYKVKLIANVLDLTNHLDQGLMSCVRHCADMVSETERQDPIRKCFQSLNHIFRLVL